MLSEYSLLLSKTFCFQWILSLPRERFPDVFRRQRNGVLGMKGLTYKSLTFSFLFKREIRRQHFQKASFFLNSKNFLGDKIALLLSSYMLFIQKIFSQKQEIQTFKKQSADINQVLIIRVKKHYWLFSVDLKVQILQSY